MDMQDKLRDWVHAIRKDISLHAVFIPYQMNQDPFFCIDPILEAESIISEVWGMGLLHISIRSVHEQTKFTLAHE